MKHVTVNRREGDTTHPIVVTDPDDSYLWWCADEMRILGPSRIIVGTECPTQAGRLVWIETEAPVEVHSQRDGWVPL